MLILADHLEEQGDQTSANILRELQSAGFTSIIQLSSHISLQYLKFDQSMTLFRDHYNSSCQGCGSLDGFEFGGGSYEGFQVIRRLLFPNQFEYHAPGAGCEGKPAFDFC